MASRRRIGGHHFEFLAHQGFDINMVLRLMARSISVEGGDSHTVLVNAALQKDEYAEFRRRLLHLSALGYARKLYVEPVTYEEVFPVPLDRALTPVEALAALDKGYRWTRSVNEQSAMLTRKVIGRIAITNYELRRLSNEERNRLNEEIQRYPPDDVYVDIRPGYPGGDYPMRGTIQLRSFNAIISFVARGIAEELGFYVEKDPRTGPVMRNPAHVLDIEESLRPPDDAEFSIDFEGKYYFIRKCLSARGWCRVGTRKRSLCCRICFK